MQLINMNAQQQLTSKDDMIRSIQGMLKSSCSYVRSSYILEKTKLTLLRLYRTSVTS